MHLLSDIEKTALGSEEKYSCANALDADILPDGISRRILLARSPALNDGASLCKQNSILILKLWRRTLL